MSSSEVNVENAESNKKLTPFKLAVILGSLGAFGPLSVDMYLPALPLVAEDFNTTQTTVQLSLTFFLFGIVAGQLLIGPISDSTGRKTPLLIGLVIYTIASLCCIFTTSVVLFIALRFIQGLSGASGMVLSRAILRDYFSGKELTKTFAMLALIQGAAPVLAPVLGGIVLLFAPWKGVFVFLTIVGLTMFFVVRFLLPESLEESKRTKGSVKKTLLTFRQLLFDRSFIGFAIAIGLLFSVMFAYISSSSFVLQNVYGLSAQMYSFIFAINGMGLVLFSQLTGRLVSRISEYKLLMTGILLNFAGTVTLLLLLIVKAEIYFIILPLFISVASFGMVNTTAQSLALQNQGKIAGSASALLGVCQYVFAGIVAPLAGLGANPAVSMGVAMVSCSIGGILVYIILIRTWIKKVQN